MVFDKSDHPLTVKKLPPEISVSYDKIPGDRSKSIMVVANLLKRKEVSKIFFLICNPYVRFTDLGIIENWNTENQIGKFFIVGKI